MPYLSKKRVWTQQPTNPVKVDVNNELGKKLAYACLLGPSLEDVVTGNPPVDNVNNPSVVPTNYRLSAYCRLLARPRSELFWGW